MIPPPLLLPLAQRARRRGRRRRVVGCGLLHVCDGPTDHGSAPCRLVPLVQLDSCCRLRRAPCAPVHRAASCWGPGRPLTQHHQRHRFPAKAWRQAAVGPRHATLGAPAFREVCPVQQPPPPPPRRGPIGCPAWRGSVAPAPPHGRGRARGVEYKRRLGIVLVHEFPQPQPGHSSSPVEESGLKCAPMVLPRGAGAKIHLHTCTAAFVPLSKQRKAQMAAPALRHRTAAPDCGGRADSASVWPVKASDSCLDGRGVAPVQ